MSTIHLPAGLQRLDLNLLRVLDVVSRERSLRRAADALFLTPSAVSHALARLRDLLGDPLFVRQGRGVVPTPMAARLAPSVREALASLERALLDRRSFDPRRDLPRLTVALPEELEALFVPAIFGHLRASAPHLALSAVRLDRTQMRADLSAGRIDAAFDVAQPAPDEIVHGKVFEDTFCVVSAESRPSLGRESYLAGGHVAVSSRPTGPALEDFRFGAQGVTRRVVVRCQRYETACHIVAASDLLLTMPRRLAEARRRPLGLRVHRSPLEIAPIEVHLYSHRRTDEGPGGRWIRTELEAALAPLALGPARSRSR